MPLQKITEAQMNEKGVCAAPNVLKGQPAENKAIFDRMVRQLVAPAYNAAVDAIDEINETERGIQAAEAVRQTAEQSRDAAETARADAEEGRAAEEAVRSAAETARAGAETDRDAAEAARAAAEQSRSAAEIIRAEAETQRQAAETDRFGAEEARETAEQSRDAAETARSVWESYDSGRAYGVGNKVVYHGSSYRCVKDCSGIAPPNGTHWLLIAARGADGTGVGDMLADVYDPQGKAQDVFAFTEELVSAHTADAAAHITSAERTAWNGKAAGTHAARHASGGADAITPASIGAAASSHTHTLASLDAAASSHTHTLASLGAAATKTLTCTVPVSWTASGDYYYQQVTVSGMLAADNPIADIKTGSDQAANKLYAEAWSKVQSIDTLKNAVKLWCTEAPTTAFPVQFKVVR